MSTSIQEEQRSQYCTELFAGEFSYVPIDGKLVSGRNHLNDLTPRDWLRFQKSWFTLSPKPRERDVLLHPAKFPEELVRDFISFFTKQGQTVLDPMVGTGSVLMGCAELGRNGIGVELLEKYAKVTVKRLKNFHIQQKLDVGQVKKVKISVLLGDARNLDRMKLSPVDYCITSPPYWDMLHRKGFETQRERKAKNLDVHYSDDPKDLGNITDYNVFINELVRIYRQLYDIMKPKGYLTIIVKNVKKGGAIFPLAWDIAREVGGFFTLKDEKIWCQNDIKLAPYGYGNAWVSNTVHHYCLNFRKER